MAELAGFVSRNEQLQNLIKRQIIEAAEGMFLLARLQFDPLVDTMNLRELKRALARLEKGFNGLDSAYDAALNRIDHQRQGYRNLARKALLWVTYARRELSIEELREAIAIEPGWEDLNHDEDLSDADDIVSACQGLVEVDQKSRIIRLVHYTTQEYFERVRERWLPNGDLEITRSCLAYLSMSVFAHDQCEWNMNLAGIIRKYKLLAYAGKYWGVHGRTVNDEQLTAEILKVLTNEGALCFVSQLALANWGWLGGRYGIQISNFAAIHICTYFGLKQVVQNMIRDSDDINPKDSWSRIPLSWAAICGHTEIVQLLLARSDVDINARDWHGKTPLFLAAEEGHRDIVQLLLARLDVAANAPDCDGRTPLYRAAEIGYNKIVQLLLARSDVDINARDWHGETPLMIAAAKKDPETVQLLLARSDVEASASDLGYSWIHG